jgi:hypothetical protein
MKGRWGQTLGVWLLATIITLILFSVGWIPQVVVGALEAMGGNVMGTAGLVLAGGVAGVAQVFSPAVTYTAITFQYYNLIEQKEQVSLQEEVSRVEQSAQTDTAQTDTAQTDTAQTDTAQTDTAPSETDGTPAASPAAGATLAEDGSEAEDGDDEAVSSSDSNSTDDRRWQDGDRE